jgi:hypothetical protein
VDFTHADEFRLRRPNEIPPHVQYGLASIKGPPRFVQKGCYRRETLYLLTCTCLLDGRETFCSR